MTEKIENLILEHMRAIRADLASLNKRAQETTLRLQTIEAGIASVKSDIAHHYSDIALVNARNDATTERIERIERRLELSSG